MLDTDTCISLIKNKLASVQSRLIANESFGIALSAITQSELCFGVEKSGSKRNHTALELFLRPLVVLDFDSAAARVYGQIRCLLESAGRPIGPLDTQIAAHAISSDLILVTNNVREFSRVPNLRIENWAQ